MRYLILILFLLGCSQPIECNDANCSAGELDMEQKTGWSQGTELTPGSAQFVRFLQAQFGDHGNYTVQFNVSDPNNGSNLGAGDVIRSRATIMWKVNGNPVTRVLDIADGTTITGVAESVDISAIDNSQVAVPATAKKYTVVATVAKGSRPSVQQPPRYTLPKQTVNGGVIQSFTVPVDAGVISVMVTVAPNAVGGTIGAYQVLVHQCQNATILKSYDPRQSDFVPIMPGTTTIQVEVDAAIAQPVVVEVTFGIDG